MTVYENAVSITNKHGQEIRLSMVPRWYGPTVHYGWQAALANGWHHCTHLHKGAEEAIDCLHEAISEVFKP